MKLKLASNLAAATFVSMVVLGCGQSGESESESVESTTGAVVSGPPIYVVDGTTGSTCTVAEKDGSFPTSMLCCPPGTAMVGFGKQDSRYRYTLKCKSFSSVGQRYLSGPNDPGAVRSFPSRFGGVSPTSMHACPLGSVMIGIHLGLNRFGCQGNVKGVVNEYADTTARDSSPPDLVNPNMHSCSSADAMSGYHFNLNTNGCMNDIVVAPVP